MSKTSLHEDQLYNEDAFRILMDYEIMRTIRYPTPISLLYIEMTPHTSDGETSQEASSIFETTINLQLRLVDIPARYGTGYLILLPATNEAGAGALCERLLSIFENEFEMEAGKTVRFSLQIGVASHTGGPTLMKEILIQTAETSLQRSRLKGFNTIGTIDSGQP